MIIKENREGEGQEEVKLEDMVSALRRKMLDKERREASEKANGSASELSKLSLESS